MTTNGSECNQVHQNSFTSLFLFEYTLFYRVEDSDGAKKWLVIGRNDQYSFRPKNDKYILFITTLGLLSQTRASFKQLKLSWLPWNMVSWVLWGPICTTTQNSVLKMENIVISNNIRPLLRKYNIIYLWSTTVHSPGSPTGQVSCP